MKSYYIESLDLWVLSVSYFLDLKQKEKIASDFKSQSDKVNEVVVLDGLTKPLEILQRVARKPYKARQRTLKFADAPTTNQ